MLGDREMEEQKRRLRMLAKKPIMLAISPASPYPNLWNELSQAAPPLPTLVRAPASAPDAPSGLRRFRRMWALG